VRPRAKVTIDSLQNVVYEKSIGTKMDDLDLCLEVISRSCQPFDVEYLGNRWFQRTTNRKCYMGYQMFTWPM